MRRTHGTRRGLAAIAAVAMLVAGLLALPRAARAENAASDDETTSYDLYWYALIPGADIDATDGSADERWFGLGVSTISGVEDPSTLDGGSDVTSYGQISLTGTAKALFPDITYGGQTYKYAPAGSENADKAGYYTLQPARVRVSSGANAGYNEYNPTASGNTYHYDNVIVLNEKDVLTVNFSLRDAGETSFTVLTGYAQRLSSGSPESSVKRPSASDVPATKVDKSGVTYVFDGWYLDEGCSQRADFTGTVTRNTVYYGRYLPQLGSLSISKHVSGSAANVADHFTFELSCPSLAGKTYSVDLDSDGAEGQDDVTHPATVAFDANGVATLQLRHGETATLQGLPAGVTVSVRETGLSGNAKTSTSVSVDGASVAVKPEGSTATSTDPVEARVAANATQVLDFTNTAMAQPDTGIGVDPTPMAALLCACGAGGVAMALSSKRRRNEQAGR